MTTYENGEPMPDVWTCEPKQAPPWVKDDDELIIPANIVLGGDGD